MVLNVLLFLLVLLIILILIKILMPNFIEINLILLHAGWRCFETICQDYMNAPRYNTVSLYSQSSSVAVLTGGSRGLGLGVLKKLLQCEMTVILGVRNIEAARKSVESYIDSSLLMNKVIYENCDTGDLSSVREFAKRVQERFRGINLLINNAGIMEVPFKLTKDGFESQMAINYIGHFLLTHLLMPQLIYGSKESGKTSRVVSVSSCSHFVGKIRYNDFNYTNIYHGQISYSDSKLAQVMFTRHLHQMCMENNWNVHAYSCHPGFVNTGLFATSLFGPLDKFREFVCKNLEQGARTVVYAAIAPEIESNGGAYITNCRPSKMSYKAMDNAECRKLFLFTCDRLGIKSFGSE